GRPRYQDLAEQAPLRRVDLDAGGAGGVDASGAVRLEAVGNARCDDREEAVVDEVRAVGDVEGADVVRQVDVVRAGTLDGRGIVDVEDVLARREGQAVRLVE